VAAASPLSAAMAGTILVGGATSAACEQIARAARRAAPTGGGGSKSPGRHDQQRGRLSGGRAARAESTVAKSACSSPPPADPQMPGYPADQHTKFQTQATTTLANLSLAEKAQQHARGTDPGPSTSRNWTDTFRQPDNTAKGIKGFTFRDGPRGVNLDAPIQATNTVHGKSTVFSGRHGARRQRGT